MKQITVARFSSFFSKNLWLFLMSFSLMTASCDMFRKAESSSPPKKTTKPTKDEFPQQGDRTTSNVDTVRWKTDPRQKPPVYSGGTTPTPANPNPTNPNYPSNPTNPSNPNNPSTDNSGVKDAYTMALLLPFNTNTFTGSGISPKSQFAVDFYAGVKMAIDSLSTLPFRLNINVLDAKDGFNSLSNRYEVSRADVIMGPIDRDNVIQGMAFSTRNNITFLSPYHPTGDVDNVNPHFIQVKPSLKTHCTNIVRHVASRHPGASVVVAARTRDNEVQRFAFFEEASRTYSTSQYEQWRIEDDFNINPEAYIAQGGTTVFIVPSWNEAFVSAFLKKLNASPRRSQIVVYGMPQWLDFTGLNSLYQSLNVRISSSTFIDNTSSEVRAFRNKFQKKYGKLPNPDVYLGYDCMLYTGKMVQQYGSKFAQFLDREQTSMLHTRFQFSPVYRNAVSENSDPAANVAKYENSYVNILRYQNGVFGLDE